MNRRVEGRLALEIPGMLYLHGHSSGQIIISQLSANGCRLTGVPMQLETGQLIKIMIGGIGPFEAEVRWSSSYAAGVRLAVPLHAAIIAHFAAFVRLAG